MKLRTGFFFSLPDKLECIYKVINDNKGSYKRDWKNDKKLIDFLAARRNTVHNQGIHKGKDKEIEINNKRFLLCEGKPYHSDSWINDLLLLEELIHIYTYLLEAFPKEIRCENINSFVIPQYDEQSINILTTIINDYKSNLSDDYKLIIIDNLINKFKLSESPSCKIIEEINNIDCDVWNAECTLRLLSII